MRQTAYTIRYLCRSPEARHFEVTSLYFIVLFRKNCQAFIKIQLIINEAFQKYFIHDQEFNFNLTFVNLLNNNKMIKWKSNQKFKLNLILLYFLNDNCLHQHISYLFQKEELECFPLCFEKFLDLRKLGSVKKMWQSRRDRQAYSEVYSLS